jgi:hypothetical protein
MIIYIYIHKTLHIISINKIMYALIYTYIHIHISTHYFPYTFYGLANLILMIAMSIVNSIVKSDFISL